MSPGFVSVALLIAKLFFLCARLKSQDLDSINQEIHIEESVSEENIAKINETVSENDLQEFLTYPLNLNQASSDEILRFPLWNSYESILIATYILHHRPILSVLELQSIEGIPTELIRRSLPYLTTGNAINKISLWKAITSPGHHSVLLRWSKQFPEDPLYRLDDSLPSAFLGSSDKVYFRFKSALPGKYAFGICGEKDAGEPWFCPRYTPTIDFISCHVMFENINRWIQSIIIGDYNLRLGQGLLIDNGFSVGKTVQFGSIAKSASVIKPYQSVSESDMLRGLATKLNVNKELKLLLFYSRTKQDANQIETTNPTNGMSEFLISTLQNSGYHRNRSELEDKKIVASQYAGMAMDYNRKACKIGLNAMWSYQDKAYFTEFRPDKIFQSKEKTNYTGSVHHQYIFKNSSLIGEFAISTNAQTAMIENLLLGLGKGAEAIFSYRNFKPGFHQQLSNTISSNSMSTNEKALYFALNLYPSNAVMIHGRAEFTDVPWLRYQSDVLTSRQSYLCKIQITQRKKWTSYIQFRRQIEDLSIPDQNILKENKPAFQYTHQVRVHLETKLQNSLIWRSRIELSWVKKAALSARGILIAQDLLLKSISTKITANIRFAIFDISDYDARIYTFENDVLSQYQLIAYNGRGIRLYTNLRYPLSTSTLLEFRYSASYFFKNRIPVIAVDKTESDDRSEIKFQLRYRF